MTAAINQPAENLVQVFRAQNPWQGSLIVGYLEDQGVAAHLRPAPSVPPVDYYEFFNRNDTINGIFVMEHETDRARTLIDEFLATAPDMAALDELSAHKPHPDRGTFARLRIFLVEERRTFALAGWLGVTVLVLAWLWSAPCFPPPGWGFPVALIAVAWLVGRTLSKRQ